MNPVTTLELSRGTEPVEAAVPISSQSKSKPRVWTAFATWFLAAIAGQMAAIAGFVAVGMGIGVVMGAQGADATAIQARVAEVLQQPLPMLLLSLLPFQLGMGAVVLLAAGRSKQSFRERLGLVPPTVRTPGGFALATLAAFTLSTAFASAIGGMLLLGEPQANPIGTAINNGSWWSLLAVSVILSVIPAIVEEILFRGYIQRRLLERWSPSVAIGVTTLLFAVLHADSLQHMIAVVPLGIITGLLAYRTNSVKPGMLVHAIHNAGATGFAALIRLSSPTMSEESLGVAVLSTIAVLGLIGLPAVISLLRRGPVQDDALSFMASPATQSLAGPAV